jgi:hypothetical protein
VRFSLVRELSASCTKKRHPETERAQLTQLAFFRIIVVVLSLTTWVACNLLHNFHNVPFPKEGV